MLLSYDQANNLLLILFVCVLWFVFLHEELWLIILGLFQLDKLILILRRLLNFVEGVFVQRPFGPVRILLVHLRKELVKLIEFLLNDLSFFVDNLIVVSNIILMLLLLLRVLILFLLVIIFIFFVLSLIAYGCGVE